MGNQFASGRKAIAICDRCGEEWLLKELKQEVVKQRLTGMLMCPDCWDPDQPQLMLGTFPIDDPQGLRTSRRDTSYLVSGTTVLGTLGGGSRVIEWGWNPVGGADGNGANLLTPNALVGVGQVGQVVVGTLVDGVSATGQISDVSVTTS